MKTFPWIVAGAALGIAAYVILNQPAPGYATGSDDVEDAADRASAWGSKRRVSGTGTSLVGSLKESVGNLAGDDQLAGEGILDQAAGAVEDTAGRAAHAVADTLHDINR